MKVVYKLPLGYLLGSDKIWNHLLLQFFWPGMHQEALDFCKSCPESQWVDPGRPQKVLLVLIPLTVEPFKQVVISIMMPHEKSTARYQYILVLMD